MLNTVLGAKDVGEHRRVCTDGGGNNSPPALGYTVP